jgi:signal transduction histidine kinase
VVIATFLLLAAALTASILVVRQVQSARIRRDAEIDLVYQAAELRRIAELGRRDSGQPYGRDVSALFDEFLQTHDAGDDQAFYTIPLDRGQPGGGIRRSFGAPAELIEDQGLLQEWTVSTEPSIRSFETSAGDFISLAVPVLAPESGDGDSLAVADGSGDAGTDEVLGVFVVAHFVDNELNDLDELIGVLALAGFAVLAVATMLAWCLAGRVVSPVRQLTRTARAVTHSNLSARIPVNGHSELAELGRTFNEMVDRLDSGARAQRQFLDDVAHDLRTPITIARGHLEVLGDDPEEREAAVAIVIDELDRMGRAVSDLLVLAKAEQPHFLRLQPVDYGDLAADILARLSTLAPRQWTLEAPRPGVLAGVADADRLLQAMLNLAVNAAQHTSDGDEIGVGIAVDSPGWVRLWVRDQGTGVDPEVAAGLFGRYARGGNGKAANHHDGVGLGLAIVDAIATAHGGSAEHVPTPGGGATFTIRIPLEPPNGEVPA